MVNTNVSGKVKIPVTLKVDLTGDDNWIADGRRREEAKKKKKGKAEDRKDNEKGKKS